MTRIDISPSAGALVAGALCLAMLGGMIVTHAWPLWTGEPIRMRVESASSHDARRGEHVALRLRENRLWLGSEGSAPKDALAIRVPEGFWPEGKLPHQRWRSLRGRALYVQLAPDADGVLRGVAVSRRPVAGQLNLRGLVTDWNASEDVYYVEYGVESLFVQQGTAPDAVQAVNTAQRGIVEIALTSSGRARTRALIAGDRRW
jgi:hypothetical protein